MPKKAAGKKSGNDDAAGAGDAAAGAAAAADASAPRSPRAERQRLWSARADDAVTAMQQVQQLLHQHATEAETAKKALDHLTATAALLWGLDVEELPAPYRDKSRPTSQRVGSAASGRGGSAADHRSSSSNATKQAATRGSGNGPENGGTGAGATAAAGGADKNSGGGGKGEGATAETVESAIRQLTPAQRSKVSVALQTLFYAPTLAATAAAAPTSPVSEGVSGAAAAAAAASPPASPAATPAGPNSTKDKAEPSSLKSQPPQGGSGSPLPASPAATAADGESPVLSDAARRGNNTSSNGASNTPVIPAPLLTVMRELQGRRIQLETQLTTATAATTQQLQRFQLLQEESMVAQYAVEALRREGAQAAA